MQFSWNKLNIGGKMISIAAVLAIISMFMPWVDMVTRTTSGFQELAFVLLLLYAYPLYKMLRNQSVSLILGAGSSILAAAASVAFMEWKTIPFEGVDLCFAGQGTYLFSVASILLFAGILKYQPYVDSTTASLDDSKTPAE